MYVLLSGVVLFLAIFLGIRTGLAVQGGRTGELTPKNLPNQTLLKVSEQLPDMAVTSLDGRDFTLRDITRGKKTIIAVVMPGCGPCKKLLTQWQRDNIGGDSRGRQMVLLAVGSREKRDMEELTAFADEYPVYFCDVAALDDACGISSFPSILGVGGDNAITFIASSFVYQLDNKFFDKYL
ncbi:MAG: redoxin domain-containing protein [candidate division Zixibacteria bacterium]|nr:redoxin domain-containing protein [candidate division Zixibacteria bacterium]